MSRMLGKATLGDRIQMEPLLRVWRGGLSASCFFAEPKCRASATCDLPQASTVFGQYYDSHEQLGHGSFGVVLRAQHKASHKNYTIKVIGKSTAGEGYREHIVHGGMWDCLLEMTIDFPHPNILKYFDLFEGNHHYIAVMENLEGLELAEQYERDALQLSITESYCQRVMRQVLAALGYLHDCVGIVHRDIKLENFRYRTLSCDSELVLVDFGLPRFIGEEVDWNVGSPGTALYLAPEVVKLRACGTPAVCNAAVDLWATGVMLYMMIARTTPWDEKDLPKLASDETVARLLGGALSFLETKSVTSEVVDLLNKMLALNSDMRLPADQAAKHPWFSKAGDCVQMPLNLRSQLQISASSTMVSDQSAWCDSPSSCDSAPHCEIKMAAKRTSYVLEVLGRAHLKFCGGWEKSATVMW